MRKINNNMETLQNDSNGRNDNIGYEDLEISDTTANTPTFAKFIEKQRMNLKMSNKYIYLLLLLMVLFFMGLFISREVSLHRDDDKILELTKHLGTSRSDLHSKEYEGMQKQFEANKQIDSAKEQIEKSRQEIARLEKELEEKDATIDSLRKQIEIKNSIHGNDNINSSNISSAVIKNQNEMKGGEDILELIQTLCNLRNNNSIANLCKRFFGNSDPDTTNNVALKNEAKDAEANEITRLTEINENLKTYLDTRDRQISNLNDEISKYAQRMQNCQELEANLTTDIDQKEAIIREKNLEIEELHEITGNNSIDIKALSDTVDKARSNISTLKDENSFLLTETKKNYSTLVQDLEMLKEEFPQVKIKLYMPYMNQHPNDHRTYICRIKDCDKHLLRDDLITHLMDYHPTEVTVNTELLRKITLTGSWDRAYILVHGELFRVGSQIKSDGTIWFYLIFFGPDELAVNYGYEVELLPSIRTRKSLYASGECSVYTKDVPIYLKVESHRASAFIQNNSVEFKVKIVKK